MKIPKRAYTPEFRERAVKRVEEGQRIGAAAMKRGWSSRPPAQRGKGGGGRQAQFNRFKNERVHGILDATPTQIKAATFEDIVVSCHRKRLRPTLGLWSPAQFLAHGISAQGRKNG